MLEVKNIDVFRGPAQVLHGVSLAVREREVVCLVGRNGAGKTTTMETIMGFLPGSDPRLLATVDAIERGLSDERGLLYRYRGDDGFEEPEGTFLLCTFWLAHALAITGQVDRAQDTLHRAAGYATDLGLFAEQVDPNSGDLLGNFPQAFSNLGLVNAAQALADAEDRLRV